MRLRFWGTRGSLPKPGLRPCAYGGIPHASKYARLTGN